MRIALQRSDHHASLDLLLVNLDPGPDSDKRFLGSILTLLHLGNRIAFHSVKIGDDVHRIRDRVNNIVRTPTLRNNLDREPSSILMVTLQNQICKSLRPIVRDLSLFLSSHRTLSLSFFPAFLP